MIIAGVVIGVLLIVYIVLEESDLLTEGWGGACSGCVPDSGLRGFGCII